MSASATIPSSCWPPPAWLSPTASGGAPGSVFPIDPIEPDEPAEPADAVEILIVCTANRCRSPIGEAILRQRLAERHVAATVGSAGFLAPGYPAMDEAVATAADAGLDLTGHRSRIVTPELIGAADLVIVMERQHVVELAGLAPRAWPRAFQLRDLVRRAQASGGRARGQPFAAWLAELGAGRTATAVLAAPLADDIADPVGRPSSDYDHTRQVLDDLLTRLAGLITAT